jgi:hypothetical protein
MNSQLDYNEFKTRANKLTSHKQELSVKTYTLLDPVNYKTKIRGYWTDGNGKLYKDYLLPKVYHSWGAVKIQAVKVCKDKDQQCIFIKGSRAGYIVDPQGKVINLFKCKRVLSLKGYTNIRQTIKRYKEGLTIYKDLKGYKAEIYF